MGMVAWSIGSLYLLYIFYLAVMSLYRAYLAKTITRTALVLGYPILALGAVIDCFVNTFIASILFLEFPQELLLTYRLTRLKQENGWRGKIANWVCANLLNEFDPSGNHCQ